MAVEEGLPTSVEDRVGEGKQARLSEVELRSGREGLNLAEEAGEEDPSVDKRE